MKILYISQTKVVDNILVPLLVRCSLDLFKCCGFVLLLWSIKLKFFSWHKYLSYSFISWTLCWCLSFFAVIPEIETPRGCVFTGIARLIMAFAISFFFPDGRSFVPIWKIISSAFSRRIGFIWSSRHLVVGPWYGPTKTLHF